MRSIRKAAIAFMAVAGLTVAASAQPPPVLPPGAKVGEAYECPDPTERSSKPECCRVTVEIDSTGKAVSAKAACTHPGYVDAEIQCELQRSREPRIKTGGVREGYSRTFTRTHLPSFPRSNEEFRTMLAEANARCSLIKDPD